MKPLAMLPTLFLITILSDSGEGKPLFFDAVTGALNGIRKIIFGNEQGLFTNYKLIELWETTYLHSFQIKSNAISFKYHQTWFAETIMSAWQETFAGKIEESTSEFALVVRY